MICSLPHSFVSIITLAVYHLMFLMYGDMNYIKSACVQVCWYATCTFDVQPVHLRFGVQCAYTTDIAVHLNNSSHSTHYTYTLDFYALLFAFYVIWFVIVL